MSDDGGPAFPEALMSVIEEINAERCRQVEEEGFTAEHDDRHYLGQLALAASCYAVNSCSRYIRVPPLWPWSRLWWKPKNPRRDLIRAAALIVAEIERLDREQVNHG